MRYSIEDFDYDGLVAKMAEAGMDKMAFVLNEELKKLPKPQFKTEIDYFWKALYNASRKNESVWLWLITVRPDLDTGQGHYTNPELVPDWPLPVITPDDEPISKDADIKNDQRDIHQNQPRKTFSNKRRF